MTADTSTSSADSAGTANVSKIEDSRYPTLFRTGTEGEAIARRTIPQPKFIGAVFVAAALLLVWQAPAGAANPSCQASSITTDEDTRHTLVSGNFNFTDSDLDDLYSVDIENFPALGKFYIGTVEHTSNISNAQLTNELVDYEPPDNANGTPYTTFTFKVRTGTGFGDLSANTCTMTINVTAVSDRPGSISGTSTFSDHDENTTTIGDFSSRDIDDTTVVWSLGGDDSDDFSLQNQIDTASDAGVDSTVSLVFSPAPDFEDPTDNGTNNVYNVTVLAADATDSGLSRRSKGVRVTVKNVNEVPVARADTADTVEATAVDIDVVGNDTDGDGDALSVTAVVDPGNGMAARTEGSTTKITYTPDANFAGVDTFTYTVSDGSGADALSDSAMVTVNVAPVVSGNATISYDENGTESVATYTAGGSPTWSLSGDDSEDFSISAGVLAFNRSPDRESPDDFDGDSIYEVTVEATVGSLMDTLDVTVTVNNVNEEAPVAVAGETKIEYAENGTAVIETYMITESDIGENVRYTGLSGDDSSEFSVNLSNDNTPMVTARLSFTAAPNFEMPSSNDGDNVYEVTLNFSDGNTTEGLDITITVTDVNEAPVATDDSGTTKENEKLVIRVLENDSDVDGDALTVTQVGTPSYGAAEITDNSTTITYTPNTGYVGSDTFNYTISDGATSPLTATGKVDLTVIRNVDLSDLTISGGTLDTTFEADTTSYTVAVSNSVTSLTLTPTTADPTAKVTVNGTVVASGRSFEIALPAGAEPTITVLVTAADGSIDKTYTIKILRGPRVAIATEAAAPVRGRFEVTITFNREVTGFEQSDLQVTNGTVTDFSGSGKIYEAEITPSASGEVTVEIGEDVAEDGAGYGNQAAAPLVIEADLAGPEVVITSEAKEPVGGAFEVTITFSEAVTGFEQSDIEVTNGTVENFIEASPSEYQVTIKPTVQGQPVAVGVPEEIAEDGAGNGNEAAEPFEVETAIEVSYAAESYTASEGGDPIAVTVKLSQANDEDLTIPIQVRRPETTELDDYTVEGLAEWDAQEGSGTLSFAAGATEQTFTIAADQDGDGDDETVELGFGELPAILMAGDPSMATVTLEDNGLVELQVSFGQAVYSVKEGQRVEIELTVSPAADRPFEVPLVVALEGGTMPEDYKGVPASAVFAGGESMVMILVELLADEVNDPGEGIVLSLGELPEAVMAGDPSSTRVHFIQQRTAEQFTPSLEAMLAVMARSIAESAQTAIEGRFERYRQWSRLKSSGGAVQPMKPGTGDAKRGGARSSGQDGFSLGQVGSFGYGGEGLERALRRGSLEPSALDAAKTGPSGETERQSRPSSWSLALGSLRSFARSSGQTHSGIPDGHGMASVGRAHGLDRTYGSGLAEASAAARSRGNSETRDQEVNLSGVSVEMPLGEQERGKGWVPVLWAQGDLQRFDGDLTRLDMNYSGELNAAHVGLDLYGREQMLAGLSFMRSWGALDYTDDGLDGVLESDLNTVHPYLYWQPNERVSVWGIGGLGGGQVDVQEPGRTHSFEAAFRMLAGGVRATLKQHGGNEWGLRADAFTAQLETDASEDIAKVSGDAHRSRMMLEWMHERTLRAGRSLSAQVEAGGRFDGGDADRGAGLETGFRLRYLDAIHGLDVALNGRVLVVHESEYQDWGVGLQASWDPGAKQRGLRATVTSSWGRDGSGRTTLWDNPDAVTRPLGIGALGLGSGYLMESEVAYAAMNALGLPGLLTPYSRVRWSGEGRELAWGTAWSLSAGPELALPATFELEGLSRESRSGRPENGLLLRMSIPF